MRFKKLSYKFLMSIPHLAMLFDMRRHQRYEPREGLGLEIRIKDVQIDGQLLDISLGGMTIISTSNLIEDSETISLVIDDYCVNLPCKAIRKIENYHGINFGSMDWYEFANLKYFIDHFTKDPLKPGPTEMLR